MVCRAVEGADQPELEAFCMHELLHRRPSLLRALALPAGFLVVFNGDQIEAVLDKRTQPTRQHGGAIGALFRVGCARQAIGPCGCALFLPLPA
jgi:hypothetical protein